MKRIATLVSVALVLFTGMAQGAVVTVGDNTIDAAPGQVVNIMVTGGEPVDGVFLTVGLGDGGPVLGNLPGPAITDVILRTGTIFDGITTPIQNPTDYPQFQQVQLLLDAGVTRPADGILATLVIDATGFDGNTYGLEIDNVFGFGAGASTTFFGADGQFNNGSITVGGGGTVRDGSGPGRDRAWLPNGIESPDDMGTPNGTDSRGRPAWEFTNDAAGGDGQWYDPTPTGGFMYETTDGSKFTAVDLPTSDILTDIVAPDDIDNDYTLGYNDGTTGWVYTPFTAGSGPFTFPVPVSLFTVNDIELGVDSDDPMGFPTFLAFDQTTVSFTMTPIPEPSTVVLLGLGLIGLVGFGLKRRSA